MKLGTRAYYSNQTIKQRFGFWIGAVIVGLGFLIIVPLYMTEKKDKLDEAENQLQQVVALQSLYIESWTQEKLDTIKRFASSEDAKLHHINNMKKDVENYSRVNSEFAMIFYVDNDGYTYSDTNPSNKKYVGDRPYFEQAVLKKNYISDVMKSKETDTSMITFSAPILDDQNNFQGAIVGIVTLEILDKLMKQLSFGKTGEVFILDSKGKVVAASRTSSKTMLEANMTSEMVNRAAAGSTSTDSYIGFYGKKVYGKYKWSEGKTWIVIGEITENEVFQKLNQLTITVSLIVVAALLLSFAAAVTLASRIERPVRYLLRATKVIQNGNYNYQIDEDKIKRAPIELRELCATFNMMSNKLKTNITLLEHSALVDPLTQIHNRRYMMQEGDRQLQVCMADDKPCSVIMLDIDHFKKINDTYGHLIGDRVLHHIASLLRQYAGADCIVARYGGEEFILLASFKDAQKSVGLAEMLRCCLMENPYRNEEVEIQLTASIGVAEYSSKLAFGTTVLEDMVSRADYALYRAKSAGRNKVELDQ
ncbi:GGDEF domain-containing protein [Paenibacillus sp. N3.4]|uniref:sensor domain-containing diguanylate cyclase n=1 Tax=Paenibacillus sp. N3.4 TaxID=2603222 RepID=UPI0011CA7FD6|nr:GGDEF domain-containing protein [Paenibacillus sp. N3.4]TXK80989.1 diguanylate cyclase [Paenibacillus sp. N3.4]